MYLLLLLLSKCVFYFLLRHPLLHVPFISVVDLTPVCFVSFFDEDSIVSRYRALEAGVNDLLESLQQALAKSQGINENLDMLLTWLDTAEKEQHRLEKGTVIPTKREPVMEQAEQNKVC